MEQNISTGSKELGHSDESGFHFAKEMLEGDVTYGINFDRVQWHSGLQRFVIIELLLCEEKQLVTPHSSHPNKYFHLNAHKFTSLWKIAQKLDAILYLVNYAKAGTTHADKVRLMQVLNVDKTNTIHPVKTCPVLSTETITRKDYSDWFRVLNRYGQFETEPTILAGSVEVIPKGFPRNIVGRPVNSLTNSELLTIRKITRATRWQEILDKEISFRKPPFLSDHYSVS